MSSKINYKRVWSTSDAGLTFRVSTLENNEYKITYFESVSAATGTITKPAQSTILLDQFFSGIDAYVSTIVNGQPTGILPQTSGGSPVDVSSFDALGNYTLTGTPSAFPVAIIYVLKIKAIYYSNLNVNNILELEGNENYSQLVLTNRQTASYPLALTDSDKLVEMNVASANDLTIPLNSSVPFIIGTQILLSQYGAGQTTILPTGGVTLRSALGKTKLTSQYSGATLIKIATDEWYLFGDITT